MACFSTGNKLAALALLLSMTLPAQAQEEGMFGWPQPTGTISTHGQFQSKVTPNKVTVVFLVKKFDKVVPTVYANNSQIAKQMVALAPALGINKTDVQTSQISIQPEYRYNQPSEDNRDRLIGYSCSRSVTFVLKDVSKLATLLQDGLQNGANGIQAVNFECTDAARYRAEARIAALKAARDKAVALAEAVGCTVGKPVSITEGYTSTYSLGGMAPALQGATNGTIGPQGIDGTFVSNISEGLEMGQLLINSEISAKFELQ